MKKVIILISSIIMIVGLMSCGERTRTQTRVDMYNSGTSNTTTPKIAARQSYTEDQLQYNTNRGTTTGQGTTYNSTASGFYRDGVYRAFGDATPYGNQAAAVTITKGRISSVYFDYIDNKGRTISNPGSTTSSDAASGINQNTGGYFNSRAILANYIIQAQTYNVNVSGANTAEIDNWKLAVKRALEQAQK